MPDEKKKKPKKAKKPNFKEDLLRVQAEFENYRKRVDRDREEYQARAAETVLQKLFPIIDTLSLAFTHNTEDNDFSQGVHLVQEQLLTLLKEHNIEQIKTDIPFDPQLHEAIQTVDTEPKNTIIQTFQLGFQRHNTILRPARVSVGGK
ncbi:MAG: nucleotide exchange factor GrpE [Candidatus Woesearchaeota archaeon]|nr:nucleotide exchange factor GrpE [Candidatus Woesearchaeota archaeon]